MKELNVNGAVVQAYPLTAAQRIHYYTVSACHRDELLNIATGFYIQYDQIDFDVNYSSVTIDLDEVNAFTPTSEDSFPERLAYALSHSLEAFINVLKGIVIGIIYLLPYAVIAAAAVFLIRRWRKRRPHRDGQLKRRHRHGKSGEDGSSGPSDRKSSQDTVDGKEVDQNAAGMTGTGTETTQ